MRIVHVVENLNRGGLERVVVNLSKEQIKNGHQCLIICLFTKGGLYDEAISNKCELAVINKKDGIDLLSAYKLRKLVLDWCGDVIHTHNPVSNYFTCLSQVFTNIPIINTRHGMGEQKKSFKRELFYKVSLLRTLLVVAVCDEARRNFIQRSILSKEKSTVVKNGINTGLYAHPDKDNVLSLKSELLLSDSSVVLGTVGRLISYKNHLALIDAVSMINIKIILIIVGGGTLLDSLKERVKSLQLEERISIVGDQSNVAEYLGVFDIFVMPSLTEGYSLSLLEACAAHLPILCTDTGGNKEIVQDGVNGMLIDGFDAYSIKAGIEKILNEDYVLMGEKSYEWVLEYGSTQKVFSDYMSYYSMAIR